MFCLCLQKPLPRESNNGFCYFPRKLSPLLHLLIIPVITRNRYNKLIEGDTVLTEKLLEYVRRPLALLTIKKAVERLPVEVLPSGIVQVQQSTTVRDKLRAEKEARQSVAKSLEQDAAAYLDVLQDIIRELDAQSETVDYHIPGVTVQSKGITF